MVCDSVQVPFVLRAGTQAPSGESSSPCDLDDEVKLISPGHASKINTSVLDK